MTREKAKARSRREERRHQSQQLGRNQLLDAAEQVFAGKGFHEATLKEIGELAEFSVGSVYSFFENKDDLFLSVQLRRGDELVPQMREVVESDAAPMEQLHALADVEVGFFRRHPNFGRLYLRTSSPTILSATTGTADAVQERFREAMDLQADVMARGQRVDVIRTGDPHVLATMFSGMISAFQATDPGVISDDDTAEELLGLAALHEMIDGAFGTGSGPRGGTAGGKR